jgi:hypothetical protein
MLLKGYRTFSTVLRGDIGSGEYLDLRGQQKRPDPEKGPVFGKHE